MDIPHKQIALFSVIAIGLSLSSADVFYQCADFPIEPVGSKFTINCNAAGKVIIVESAIIGITGGYKSPNECPITNSTCTKEISFAADYCTGYNNSCEIAQRLLTFDESNFSCPALGIRGANFINVNYSCVYPTPGTYGDVCHFDDNLYQNSTVYISSFPNFPGVIPQGGPIQCLCSFAPSPLVNGSGGWIKIRTRLLKLSSFDCVSEYLAIRVGDETRLSFCSPSVTTNNFTTALLNSPFTISYERRAYVSAATSKFFIELKVENVPVSTVVGWMTCKIGSSTDSFTTSVARRTPVATFKSYSQALPVTPAASSHLPEQLFSTSATTPMSFNFKSSSISIDNITTNSENRALFSRRSALTAGAIAGIVIGPVAFFALILVFALLFVAIRKKKHIGKNSRTAEAINVNQTFNINSGIQINQLSAPCTVNGDRVLHASTANREEADGCNGRAEKCTAYEEGAPVELNAGSLLSSGENGDTGFCAVSKQAPLSADTAAACQPIESIGNAHLKSTNDRTNEISPIERPLESIYSLVTKSSPTHSYYNITPINEDIEARSPAFDESAEVTLIDNAMYDSRLHHNITPDQTAGDSDSVPSMQNSVPSTGEYESAETTNPVFDENAEVTLIDNTMYGSIPCFEQRRS